MAEGIKVEIVSPERLVFSASVTAATLPGEDGYFTVMGDHAPLMTILKPGFVTLAGAGEEVFYVRGGFADVAPSGVTLLAEDARPAKDFDRAEIEAMIVVADKSRAEAKSADEAARHANDADRWRNLLIEAAAGHATMH